MKRSEIFDLILAKTCEICEVSEEVVLKGGRIPAVVDARCLAIQYMRRVGLSNKDIALLVYRRECGRPLDCPPMEKLDSKAKNYQRIFNGYSQRCFESKAFRLMSIELNRWCKEKFEALEERERNEIASQNPQK